MSTLDLITKYTQTALSHLPEPTQHLLRNPTAQKALGVFAGLALLRATNRFFSKRALQNWTSNQPWIPARELILLTGGCSGIGKQVMEDLASTGVRVVILDINEPNFTLPANVTFYKANITSSADIANVARTIRDNHGEPTVLINNAGVGHDGTILDEPEEKIRQTFEVNTLSHFLMVKEFLPAMVRANHGHVVTIASMASFVALGEIVDYCCTKASALAFHEGLRQELKYWYKAPNVRTSIIHPWWVRTPMIKMLTDQEGHFRQPVMTTQVVSDAICKQILAQTSGQIILPASQSVASWVRAMPAWMQEGVRSFASSALIKMRIVEKAHEA
ncbi:Short-chain dehydrogenase/reductase SDR [Penicillium cf. griseofulvum]|uniref:Short-chain dehydrogenase/reductase 3 n=1 Tax=Penicillium cf. griseofulvum TaxID=2972120 RepID=A0A9W9IWJ7_9EURO|nr:Short-chain dehydrogenase/reductase SDR [Penicillium cf. griseofulvum]KAJ5429049.1 Short-chain dehydrogenase/reductase SDR [Penicillium cf. griseofulvum]